MTTDQTVTDDEIITRAEAMGRDAGRAAATWATDGNTTTETYRWLLKGIEDGDPAVLDSYRDPSLSGEFADDPTETDVAGELGIEPYTEESSAACDAWETAARDAFWAEIERTCRVQLGLDVPDAPACAHCGQPMAWAAGVWACGH